MQKRYFQIAQTLLLVFPILFSGCNFSRASSGVMGNVRFTFPEESEQPSHYFVRNLNDDDSEITMYPTQEGLNGLFLNSGGVYLIGFIDDPSSRSIITSRDLSSSLSLIGNIKISAHGLDTLPIRESSNGEINLGTLERDGADFVSPISSDEISTQTDYSPDTLDGFGAYDDTLRKFLNPDIDGDGNLDSEEELRWDLNYIYNFNLSSMNPESTSGTLGNVPAQDQIDLSCMFQFDEGLDQLPDQADTTLTVYPEEGSSIIRTPSGGYTNSYHSTINGHVGYDYTFYFDLPVTNGTYVLDSDQTYTVQNVAFIDPGDGFEGVMIPYLTFTTASDGTASSFSWRWYTVRDGELATPTADQIDLLIKELSFKVTYSNIEYHIAARGYNEEGRWDVSYEEIDGDERTPGFWGHIWSTPYQNITGTVDISQLGLSVSAITFLRTIFLDTGSNQFYIQHDI